MALYVSLRYAGLPLVARFPSVTGHASLFTQDSVLVPHGTLPRFQTGQGTLNIPPKAKSLKVYLEAGGIKGTHNLIH